MEEKFVRRGFFSKHFGLIHLAGLRVLKNFLDLFTSFHLSSFSSHLFSSLLFHLLFTCLASSLVFSRLSSHMSLHMSCFFSCLVSSLFLCLSLCLCLCVNLSVLCGVCGVPVCTFKKRLRVSVQNASVCRFKTSPCVPAPRPHVLPHAGVVPVHTETF